MRWRFQGTADFFSQLRMSAELRKNAAHTVGWVEQVPPKNPTQTIHFKVQGIPECPKAQVKPNNVFLKAMGLLGFAVSVYKKGVLMNCCFDSNKRGLSFTAQPNLLD